MMKKLLYNAIILPYIQYASGIWGKSSKKCARPVTLAHNKAIRITYNHHFKSSVRHKYQEAGFKPISTHVESNLASFAFGCIKNLAPQSICSVILPETNLRRLNDLKKPNYIYSRTQKQMPFTLTETQNKLPLSIRLSEPPSIFKTKLKKHWSDRFLKAKHKTNKKDNKLYVMPIYQHPTRSLQLHIDSKSLIHILPGQSYKITQWNKQLSHNIINFLEKS